MHFTINHLSLSGCADPQERTTVLVRSFKIKDTFYEAF